MGPRRSGRLQPAAAPCMTGTPDAQDANKKRVSIDCLPDVLLLHVLASTEPRHKNDRREVLPLVCKRWNLLLQAPSALWEDMVVDFCCKEAPHQRLLRSAIQGWLKPRASAIKALTLKNSSADSTHSFSRDGKSLEYIFTAVSTGLQSLEVDNCNDIFTQVTLEGLQQLTQLKKLHITNFRQRLSLISFAHLTSLTSLQDVRIAGDTDYENVLTTNCMAAFPPALLSLTQLTSLSLSSRGLTEIPNGVSALSCLQRLNLDGCSNIKQIPITLCTINSLQELSLNDTLGSMLLDSICHFSLEKLSLRKSGVHQLGGGLANCTIKDLDVSHNSFVGNVANVLDTYQHLSLEHSFQDPKLLQALNLNSCEMDTFSGCIYAFTSLKVLDLGNNGIVDLPDSLSCLTRLECLNLQGNCFPRLPEVIEHLKSLCCLSLVACNYLEIPCWDTISFFGDWPRLRAIWMWKTDGVDYQDYSKAALQQLNAKLKRKRTRDSSVCYERQHGSNLGSPVTMHGITTSMTLT